MSPLSVGDPIRAQDTGGTVLREFDSGMLQPISRRRAMGGFAALGLSGMAPRALGAAGDSSNLPGHPLADRLAAYADNLRYEDLDASTVERIKTHVLDTIGCGIGAFEETPVRICR